MMKSGQGSSLLWFVSWIGGGFVIWWIIDGKES